MNQKNYLSLALLCVLSGFHSSTVAADSEAAGSYWFRHAAISPDGESIAFSHQGDLFVVETKGGLARALTTHAAWEGHPVWSRDGKLLAFASDRHGNLDIFLMPSEGGKAQRLTFHSSNDIPADFNVDGKAVLFASARNDSAKASLFPTSRLAELYQVNTSGGMPRMISTIPASEARYSGDGKNIVYRDEKAYEIEFRKHDVSAFARDIWMLDVETGKHTQLTDFAGGDHDPFIVGDKIYYLSEQQSNNFNVWSMDFKGERRKQVSEFETHPVRHLSASDAGLLCYTQHGMLFTQRVGQDPQPVAVTFLSDSQASDYETKQLTSIDEFAVSPSGKEIAIVSRGEIFVTSRDFRTTVRITNSPEQERSVSFHKDGRTLLYAGERDGKWKLYEASLEDKREKYFFAATKIEEQEIYSAETESFQPVYSPDGTKIAFLAGRDEIQILNRETGDTNVALGKEHNYSYSDGDIAFAWSADSQWLTADYAPRGRLFVPNIGVFPADGSKQPVDISHSGYEDGRPQWNRSGNVVYWASARYGQRDHGSWGREYDVMAAFLNQDAYDQFTLSKEEYELAKELESEKEKEASDSKDSDEASAVDIEWEGLDDRTVRLTKDSANITQAYLLKDASKLYFIKRHAEGSELWMRDFREDDTKLVKKFGGGASFEISSDEETIFMLSGGTLSSASLSSIGDAKSISFAATMSLKADAERA